MLWKSEKELLIHWKARRSLKDKKETTEVGMMAVNFSITCRTCMIEAEDELFPIFETHVAQQLRIFGIDVRIGLTIRVEVSKYYFKLKILSFDFLPGLSTRRVAKSYLCSLSTTNRRCLPVQGSLQPFRDGTEEATSGTKNHNGRC